MQFWLFCTYLAVVIYLLIIYYLVVDKGGFLVYAYCRLVNYNLIERIRRWVIILGMSQIARVLWLDMI